MPAVRRELTPGSQSRYSGSHYAVLQQLLVDVTDTAFEELMARLALEPVGMANSSYDQGFPNEHRARVAQGHAGGTLVPGGWYEGRFGPTGQNTGYSCFSFAWPVSGTAVAVMTDAEDCRDTLARLIEAAQRSFG